MPTNPNIPLSIPLPGYIDIGGMLDRAANQRRLALQDQDADEDRKLRRQEIELRQSKGQREAADDETMRSALKLPTRDETLAALRAAGDPRIFDIEKAYQQADELKARTKEARLKAKAEEREFLGFLATQVEGHLGDQDGGMGAAMEAIREAQELEIDGVDQIAQTIQQNPAALPEIVKRLKASVAEPVKPQPMMNVGPGSTVFDPNTKQPVFTGPQRPETPKEPPVPIVVQTATGPQLLNRQTGTVAPIKGADGKPVGANLSQAERMDSRKFAKAEPALKAIEELSEKINTASGLIAKIKGGAEKIAAQANYDDDVAEYQSIISMWTPMVARALGHTGVLTEQDVQSVKEGFPKPGDSKSLRDRKINRLRSIITDLDAQDSKVNPADALEEKLRKAGVIK